MNIYTKFFGEIAITNEQILTFPQGIPGFLEEVSFVLLDLEDNSIFQVLQSTTTSNIAFIVTNPYHFYQDYEIELDETILHFLEIETEQEVSVLSVVSLKDPFDKSTMNLQAPIIINNTKKRGKQYITNIKNYSTKHPLSIQQPTSMVKED
ncbi:flagellar assembly protein FliW [Aquibacillus sp. 3ASR75-11]|uniref:Flagellar assembly factor FliW n=1 Tax=Terrihalobacillus insolitus TaxID=2950438 RepID=A0A9X3WQX9_9BACI|nr:flagellar assembly protein FliW [Terrihalobacillus insolitus]MDC3412228.1 flagellar assembly protein FliW [Terrihalobacillus insolitus]MDC3423078.1 flagellar assembly protein FliW [Terrihalobacillus insolitus]